MGQDFFTGITAFSKCIVKSIALLEQGSPDRFPLITMV
jgi:hypothetical protein